MLSTYIQVFHEVKQFLCKKLMCINIFVANRKLLLYRCAFYLKNNTEINSLCCHSKVQTVKMLNIKVYLFPKTYKPSASGFPGLQVIFTGTVSGSS